MRVRAVLFLSVLVSFNVTLSVCFTTTLLTIVLVPDLGPYEPTYCGLVVCDLCAMETLLNGTDCQSDLLSVLSAIPKLTLNSLYSQALITVYQKKVRSSSFSLVFSCPCRAD